MKLTKIVVILAVIAGIILYFVLPANQFLLYFGIPAILIALSRIYQTSIEDLLKDNESLRNRLSVHYDQLLECEQKIYQIQTQVDNLNQDLNYDKEDEFLFCITLIFISITLASLGLVITFIYFNKKKKKRKKRLFEKDS